MGAGWGLGAGVALGAGCALGAGAGAAEYPRLSGGITQAVSNKVLAANVTIVRNFDIVLSSNNQIAEQTVSICFCSGFGFAF